MKLLPVHKFTIQTEQPLPQVIKKLASFVEPPQFRWSFSRHHSPYQGTISETQFEIHRVIHYRNSFLPAIRGEFEALPNGTAIHITMRLHPFVIGFLAFWYLTWYSFSIPISITGAMPAQASLWFLGLPLVVLFTFWCAFWYEAHRSHHELEQMLTTKITPEELSRDFKKRSVKGQLLTIGLSLVWMGVVLWQIAGGKLFPSMQRQTTQNEKHQIFYK